MQTTIKAKDITDAFITRALRKHGSVADAYPRLKDVDTFLSYARGNYPQWVTKGDLTPRQYLYLIEHMAKHATYFSKPLMLKALEECKRECAIKRMQQDAKERADTPNAAKVIAPKRKRTTNCSEAAL